MKREEAIEEMEDTSGPERVGVGRTESVGGAAPHPFSSPFVAFPEFVGSTSAPHSRSLQIREGTGRCTRELRANARLDHGALSGEIDRPMAFGYFTPVSIRGLEQEPVEVDLVACPGTGDAERTSDRCA